MTGDLANSIGGFLAHQNRPSYGEDRRTTPKPETRQCDEPFRTDPADDPTDADGGHMRPGHVAKEGDAAVTYDVKKLLTMSQPELDALFTAQAPGPIPDGEAKGTAIVAPGTAFNDEIAEVINLFAWQGKVFDAASMTLRNRILPFSLNSVIARIKQEDSWLDGKPCIVLDYSETSLVAKWVRDEIRLIAPGLYLGKVYWGNTRLIDFVLQFQVPSTAAP
jgi:hypothetical protein